MRLPRSHSVFAVNAPHATFTHAQVVRHRALRVVPEWSLQPPCGSRPTYSGSVLQHMYEHTIRAVQALESERPIEVTRPLSTCSLTEPCAIITHGGLGATTPVLPVFAAIDVCAIEGAPQATGT